MNKFAALVMLLATFFIACSFPLTKGMNAEFSPGLALCLRFAVSFLIFQAMLLISGTSAGRPRWEHILGGFFYGIYFICLFQSLNYTNEMNVAIIYTLLPAITLLISVKSKNDMAKFLPPLGLALVSAILVIVRRDVVKISEIEINRGDLLFLFGVLGMSGFIVLSKKRLAKDNSLVTTTWLSFFCSLWLFLYVLCGFEELRYNLNYNALYYFSMLVILCTIFTFFAIQFATKHLLPIQVASFSNLTPSMSLIISGELWHNPSWDNPILVPVFLSYVSIYYLYRLGEERTVA